jgi:hypothetical protein
MHDPYQNHASSNPFDSCGAATWPNHVANWQRPRYAIDSSVVAGCPCMQRNDAPLFGRQSYNQYSDTRTWMPCCN